jgi:hypothetical protein
MRGGVLYFGFMQEVYFAHRADILELKIFENRPLPVPNHLIGVQSK